MRKDLYSVLVVDADAEFADMLSRHVVARSRLKLCGKIYSGDAVFPIVQEKQPDIIIMDLSLPALDGISVIRKLQSSLAYTPIIIVTSAFSNDLQKYIINDIANAYFVRKPVSYEHLLDRAEELVKATSSYYLRAAGDGIEHDRTFYRMIKAKASDTPYTKVTEMLHDLGVPAHLNGYGYIRDAVCMVIENPSWINKMTKMVYPKLGEKYEKSATSIEKAIRTAVEISWSRGKVDILEEIFGFTVDIQKGKPTNTEYIAMLADHYNVWMK